jgi:hypothetical protein
MCGSATFTIVASRTTISCAVAMSTSASPSRRLPPVSATVPVVDCVVVMMVPHSLA